MYVIHLVSKRIFYLKMIENFTTLFKHKNTYCNNKMSWLVEVVIGCFQALREHNYYFWNWKNSHIIHASTYHLWHTHHSFLSKTCTKIEMELDCPLSNFTNIDIISKLSLYWNLNWKKLTQDSFGFMKFTAFWKHNKFT